MDLIKTVAILFILIARDQSQNGSDELTLVKVPSPWYIRDRLRSLC